VTVELGTTEIILTLVGTVSLFGGVLAAMTRWFARQVDQTDKENLQLRHEVQELRISQAKNEREIAEMRGQIGTLLTEMGALQSQVKSLEAERDNERDEKERVRLERDQLRDALRTVTDQCKHKDAQIAAYRDALALVRGESPDASDHAAAAPEPGEGAGTGPGQGTQEE
jgi:chromosome segregation ATPase